MLDEFDKDNETDTTKKDVITDIICDIIKIIIAAFAIIGIIYYCNKNIITYEDKVENKSIEEAVITDIYRLDGKYYITALTEKSKIEYTIEITKVDFMRYKENDHINIIIYVTNKAMIYNK